MPSLCLGLVIVLASGMLLYDNNSAENLILWGGALFLVSALRILLVWWGRSRTNGQMPITL